MAELGAQDAGFSGAEAESDLVEDNLTSDKAEFVLTVLHEFIKGVLQNLPAQSLNSCARSVLFLCHAVWTVWIMPL